MSNAAEMSLRAAVSTSDAASNYAKAVMAAYADFASQTFNFWADSCSAMLPKEEPKSWYRHPDKAVTAFPAGANAMFNPFGWMNWTQPARQATPNPFMMWMRAWPLEGSPAAWPMAFAFMGFGMPRTVAYPLAEANTAAMDAMVAAKTALEQSFATYRSDGGHASAQAIVRPQRAAKTAGPPTFNYALFAPWLSLMPRSTVSA